MECLRPLRRSKAKRLRDVPIAVGRSLPPAFFACCAGLSGALELLRVHGNCDVTVRAAAVVETRLGIFLNFFFAPLKKELWKLRKKFKTSKNPETRCSVLDAA